jgi:TonB family protein
MQAAQGTALITQYPPEDLRVGRGVMIAVGIHLFVAALICIILYIMGIQSLKELLEKGGAIASSGPAPEQPMVIELKVEDIKPPPTDHIEFMEQILKPKPVVIVKPPPPPKPVPKPVVKTKPHFTAPKATGSGTSEVVSGFVKGTSGFPAPGYPYEALQAGEGGTVQMQVVFDSTGAVASAQILGSSGVTILDISTRNFIYGHWKNATQANRTVAVSIVYDPSGRSVLLRQ